MRFMNTDALSYKNKPQDKCLLMEEKEKKRKYLEACLQQSHHFPPFVVLLDGLLVVNTEAMLKCLAGNLDTRWKQPF